MAILSYTLCVLSRYRSDKCRYCVGVNVGIASFLKGVFVLYQVAILSFSNRVVPLRKSVSANVYIEWSSRNYQWGRLFCGTMGNLRDLLHDHFAINLIKL